MVGGAPFSNHSARRFTIFGSSGLKKKRTNFKQCRGSGYGAFLSSIRDQGSRMDKNSYFRELRDNFFGKKFFDADLDPESF